MNENSHDNGVRKNKLSEYKEKSKGIVFLDFDGVINNFGKRDEGNERVDLYIGTASKSNIAPLNYLFDQCLKNDFYIVISSAWNIGGTGRCIYELSNIIEHETLDKVVLGCTEYMTDAGVEHYNNLYDLHMEEDEDGCLPTRGVECFHFIEKFELDENYAFIDDIDNFLPFQKDRMILTHPRVGLTMELVDKTMEMMKNER